MNFDYNEEQTLLDNMVTSLSEITMIGIQDAPLLKQKVVGKKKIGNNLLNLDF